MNDHIPKPWSWKRLHPCCHVSAKGQMSYSVTCTFLSAIQQMWWRQSLFQEPSIHAYLLLFASVPSKTSCFGHLFHSFYDPECPSFTPTAILIFPWQHLTNFQDSGQIPPLPWSHPWILNWNIRLLPLSFQMSFYCISTRL